MQTNVLWLLDIHEEVCYSPQESVLYLPLSNNIFVLSDEIL